MTFESDFESYETAYRDYQLYCQTKDPQGELERYYDGNFRSPGDLIDTVAPLSVLYPPHQLRAATPDNVLPRRPLTPEDEAVLADLAEFLSHQTGEEEF